MTGGRQPFWRACRRETRSPAARCDCRFIVHKFTVPSSWHSSWCCTCYRADRSSTSSARPLTYELSSRQQAICSLAAVPLDPGLALASTHCITIRTHGHNKILLVCIREFHPCQSSALLNESPQTRRRETSVPTKKKQSPMIEQDVRLGLNDVHRSI